jgi:hypothetical protein
MRVGRLQASGVTQMLGARSGALHAHRGTQAKDWIAELFRQLGYKVEQNVFVGGIELDLLVEHDGVRSPVDVIIYSNNPVSLSRIVEKAARLAPIAHTQGYVSPIIAVLGPVTLQAKHFARESHHARIWDIAVLREKAKSFPELRQKLAALRGGAEQGVVTQRDKEERHEEATLIERLEQHHKYGGLSPTEYEILCQEVMTFLFDPDLYGFERQTKTSDGANRYDFICRIKPGNPFWDSLRGDFRTRSILFECKNYDEPITADQIYSTERYLFSGALRTVCFLIARKGSDDGCRRAAQGALRESGKLMLLLSNEDLVKMLKLKGETDGPTSALAQRCCPK